MSEEAKTALDQIGDKLKGLPKDVANDVLAQYTARMEGFAEGFQAGKTHATQPGT